MATKRQTDFLSASFSGPGTDRYLDVYPMSSGEGTVNGNNLANSQQGGSELPGPLLEQPASLESRSGMVDGAQSWDEVICCGEGVYETVVHLEEHKHWCLECGESFQDAVQLATHQRSHTGRQRPECLECGKSFRDLSQVLRHQTVHTGERPYSCSECGQSFTQKPALDRHLRKHLENQHYTGLWLNNYNNWGNAPQRNIGALSRGA